VRIAFSGAFQVFFVNAAVMLLPIGSRAEPVRAPVLVLVQNDANVPADVAAAAQTEVLRLFALADIKIV
jgi:hypothetical protein